MIFFFFFFFTMKTWKSRGQWWETIHKWKCLFQQVWLMTHDWKLYCSSSYFSLTKYHWNLIIITLTLVDPHLKTLMYFFLHNFSFLEVSNTTTCIPKLLATMGTGGKTISYNGCAAQVFFAFLLFLFFFYFFISWRLITLQYCSGFCHTLTWINHGYTCIPLPNPPFHLPLHPITASWLLFFFFLICSEFCHTLKWKGLGFTCLPHPDEASEFYLLAAMSYDRYVAICKPLHYTTIMNNKICIQFVFCSWLARFFVIFPPLLLGLNLGFCAPNTVGHFYCDTTPLLQIFCSDTEIFEMMGYISALLTLVVTLIISYTYITKTNSKNPFH